MTSFGHSVRPMSRLELATAERYRVTCRASRGPSAPRCPRAPTHLVSYQSIGPEKRGYHSTRRVCEEHAREFAERHRLRIPRILPEAL